MNFLSQVDPQIFNSIELENKRQHETINLIASENYSSRAVLEAQGTSLTNKYAEGYPACRYYGGCENVDDIENIAIARAKEIFKADHANVQPHSGAQANMAAYFAVMQPGDTILGMNLAHGGHLTHGSLFNFSGCYYRAAAYTLDEETERIDYNSIEKIALEYKPKVIISGASAYPRIIDFERIRYISDLVGAIHISDIAHIAGLVATGLHPSPVPYAEIVTSTSHKTLRGPRGGFILCSREFAAKIDSAVFPRVQGGPLMHVIAAKAVSFKEALEPSFTEYQRTILSNARALGDELKEQGLRLISGGTDNHLLLVDLTATGINGKQAEDALGLIGIVVNRNAVPFAKNQKARTPNGIRLGTPAVTSRGMGATEMKQIAGLIIKVIKNNGNKDIEKEMKAEVAALCNRFRIPGMSN